jgi:hypothetical protein
MRALRRSAIFYFEEEPGRRFAAQAAHQGRGPPDGGELRQVAKKRTAKV